MANIRVSSIPTTIASLYADTGTAVIVSSLSIESVVLIFGESASNSYAVEHTRLHARRVTRELRTVEKGLWPLITTLYCPTGVVSRATGGSPSVGSTHVTRDETRNRVRTGEREGMLGEECQMLQRTLRVTQGVACRSHRRVHSRCELWPHTPDVVSVRPTLRRHTAECSAE